MASSAYLRCKVGDVAMIIRGPWVGYIVDVIGFQQVECFDWIVCSQGGPFSFPESGSPNSRLARAIDELLEPLRPELVDGGQALAEPVPARAVGLPLERAAQS